MIDTDGKKIVRRTRKHLRSLGHNARKVIVQGESHNYLFSFVCKNCNRGIIGKMFRVNDELCCALNIQAEGLITMTFSLSASRKRDSFTKWQCRPVYYDPSNAFGGTLHPTSQFYCDILRALL